jgi:CHAT domain/SIR2-like domain
MTSYADLECGLHRRDADSYAVELRFSRPGDEAESRLMRDEPALVQFDVDHLRVLTFDPAAYGEHLSKFLFADPALQTAFAQARSAAQALQVPLRLRLFIGPSAPELHSLRWETLRDPQDGSVLLMSEHLLFSRYLSSFDWRSVRLRPQVELSALVLIANPTDVSSYQSGGQPLAPLDVGGELARARASLGNIRVEALASGGSGSLHNLSMALHQGYDILYLVCHGALIQGEPWLWLENETGATHRVAGMELVARLRELQQCPRLVVLASCQSASSGAEARTGDGGALAALGPRLAEAGVPAVVAMQGNITMQTVAQFMPVFFQELQRDGLIDRAMAVARGVVRGQPDWWMPVLFMRLKSGRIWYVPGFAEERPGEEKWRILLHNIRRGRCTPILGPGLTESVLGSRREIAQRWAETYHFPMAPHDREDLPRVAQYLAVNQPSFLRDELMEYLRQEMLSRYGNEIPSTQRGAPLEILLTTVGAQRRLQNPGEPHRVLAELGLPIYITTDYSNLLAEALMTAGKEPQVEICRWNDDIVQLPSIYDKGPSYRSTAQRPLVYHLFGHLQEPASLILTEDDYFDYLIGVTGNKDLIPNEVLRALTDTALLFLGFQMDDWNFRVLFRSVMQREGRVRRRGYAHVAVQIDPEEGRILEPERARRYLESYFQDDNVNIYWGSAEDFVQKLQQLWQGSAS